MYYILGFPHFSMSHTVPLETKKTPSKQNCITEIEFCLILHRKLPGNNLRALKINKKFCYFHFENEFHNEKTFNVVKVMSSQVI